MSIKMNLWNACALFLTREDVAKANGDLIAADAAHRQYLINRELLDCIRNEERLSGSYPEQSSKTWKITIKTSLPPTRGERNA